MTQALAGKLAILVMLTGMLVGCHRRAVIRSLDESNCEEAAARLESGWTIGIAKYELAKRIKQCYWRVDARRVAAGQEPLGSYEMPEGDLRDVNNMLDAYAAAAFGDEALIPMLREEGPPEASAMERIALGLDRTPDFWRALQSLDDPEEVASSAMRQCLAQVDISEGGPKPGGWGGRKGRLKDCLSSEEAWGPEMTSALALVREEARRDRAARAEEQQQVEAEGTQRQREEQHERVETYLQKEIESGKCNQQSFDALQQTAMQAVQVLGGDPWYATHVETRLFVVDETERFKLNFPITGIYHLVVYSPVAPGFEAKDEQGNEHRMASNLARFVNFPPEKMQSRVLDASQGPFKLYVTGTGCTALIVFRE